MFTITNIDNYKNLQLQIITIENIYNYKYLQLQIQFPPNLRMSSDCPHILLQSPQFYFLLTFLLLI